MIPNHFGPPKILTNEEKMIESAVESCFFKSFMACVLGNLQNSTHGKQEKSNFNSVYFHIGYGLGAAIGLFSASVNPTSIPEFQGVEKTQTAREVFRELRTTTHSYGKNFALIGMVFSAVECTIESVSIDYQYIVEHFLKINLFQ